MNPSSTELLAATAWAVEVSLNRQCNFHYFFSFSQKVNESNGRDSDHVKEKNEIVWNLGNKLCHKKCQ